jgi:hypothetical protein
MNPLLTRNFSLGDIAKSAGKAFKSMYAGAGSGLFEQTSLSYGGRNRPIIVQDTRRTVDQLTWRKLLSYGRQLHANCGEVRGPVLERAMFAGAGGWIPQCTGKKTPKKVRDQYEDWLWKWMKVCDIRGQPYDFWTDMELASIMLDRDGEAPVAFVKNRSGLPRIQWIGNHRIYSHWGVAKVTDRNSPYYDKWINNGVVFDDASAPIAYHVLDESLVFSQSITGKFIPRESLLVMYEPDWCDSGRGLVV